MLLGNQHPPSPWQPPHPSWDATRPDDEVIRRGAGEAGRQAAGTCQVLAGTQTCLPPSRAAPGKPGPPVLEAPHHPCTTVGGSADWHSAGSTCAVLAKVPKSLWCQAQPSSPKLAACSQRPGDRNQEGPYRQSYCQTGAVAREKKKGKAGRCLTYRGPPSTSWHPLP